MEGIFQLWRFRALELSSKESALRLPIPIEKAITLDFVFLQDMHSFKYKKNTQTFYIITLYFHSYVLS